MPDAAADPRDPAAPAGPVGPFADAQALAGHVRTAGLRHAKLYVVDWDGVLRGKYVGVDKLLKALGDGFGFCEVLFGWDIDDAVFDGPSFAGWDSGFRDATVRLLPGKRPRDPVRNPAACWSRGSSRDGRRRSARGRRCSGCSTGWSGWATGFARGSNTSSSCSTRRRTAPAPRAGTA